ncbi:MAG: hypothetical protein DRJ56_04195 [Thermoprotei archaeon]|nr:MAG: hypothetical protein DRJ56_04195 [Thermoprotei archaeon]
MRLVLDTSFILELRRGSERAVSALRREGREAEDVAISAITKYELMVGAYYAWCKRGDARERLWLDDVLSWLTVVELSGEAIKRAARVRARALLQGRSIPDADLLVAVTADPPLKLLTFDSDHERVSDLLEEVGVKVVYLGERPVQPSGGASRR